MQRHESADRGDYLILASSKSQQPSVSVAVSNGPESGVLAFMVCPSKSFVAAGRPSQGPEGGSRNPRGVAVFIPWWRAICSRA